MIPVIIVTLGALIMLAAVINCRRLIAIVKKTEYASRWLGLFIFMIAFLASYVFYGVILVRDIHLIDPNLLVSLVFLFGAIFVFMVVALNYSTFDGLLVRKQRELFMRITETAKSLQASAKRLAMGSDAISMTSTQVAQGVTNIASDADQQSKSTAEAHGLIDQIASAINQVSKGAVEQSRSVAETTASMNQLAMAISKVAENAKVVSSAASEGSVVATRGQEAVDETISGMEKIKSTVLASAGKIQMLGEKSKQIGDIIEVIDDIAEQTNLLALNAAIEAARAGEHGKGFAVVADEVRKLAERSARATREIADLIKGIQAETLEAVAAMEQGTQEVASGTELAHNAGEAIEDMMSSINRVVSEIDEVSKAAEQISASSEKIAYAMDQIATITEENTAITQEVAASSGQVESVVETISESSVHSAASAAEISASSQEQTASVEEIAASAIEVSGKADELYELVENFKIS